MRKSLISTATFMFCASCVTAESIGAGLCNGSETTYFTCQTLQSKTISVCGSPPKTLQYRFGTRERIELSFPQDATQGQSSFLYSHYYRAQTDRTEVTFRNENVDYAIFDYAENGKQRAGLRVTLPTGSEIELACTGHITNELRLLKDVLKCDADNALSGNICR